MGYSVGVMHDRQRKGKWFLAFACAIMVVCLVQRVALLHTLKPHVLPSVSLIQTWHADDTDLLPSSCQLSAHSLLIAQPLFFDCALPVLAVPLACVALLGKTVYFFPPLRASSPPVLRIHLKNCVFRE